MAELHKTSIPWKKSKESESASVTWKEKLVHILSTQGHYSIAISSTSPQNFFCRYGLGRTSFKHLLQALSFRNENFGFASNEDSDFGEFFASRFKRWKGAKHRKSLNLCHWFWNLVLISITNQTQSLDFVCNVHVRIGWASERTLFHLTSLYKVVCYCHLFYF